MQSTRNFANKIWNASRFALMNLEDYDPGYVPQEYTLADIWIRSRFNRAAQEVTSNMERYELGEAARILYDFLWDDLCDWYIELIKPRLYGKDNPSKQKRQPSMYWPVLCGKRWNFFTHSCRLLRKRSGNFSHNKG